MKKFLVPTYLVLCLIGIFSVWYFGHESTDQEELKSESKDSLQIENRSQDVSSDHESTQKTGKGGTAGKIETEKDDPNPEKTNAAGSTAKNAVLEGEREHKKLPSAEDIAAGAAFEAYAKSEMEHKSAVSKLIEALKSGDSASLEAATENLKNARLSREETLRNLVPYSEAAAEILAADEARAAAADKVIDQITADDKKRSAEMRKRILLEGLNILSPEQQRTLLDKFPELKELLEED